MELKDIMLSEDERKTGKKEKPKGRTIKEWLEDRHPDFNASTHQVFLNDHPIESQHYSSPLTPLDVIEVRPRK